MVGFSAYYLQNPFQFILFLFPYDKMPLGIFLMEAVMLSTAGLTFQFFLKKAFGKANLLFSTAYSFIGEAVVYFTLPIYFCNYILLPLVILGLYRLFYDDSCSADMSDGSAKYRIKGKGLYIFTLSASIFCNYYLGYMLCIFLVLYFGYLCIIGEPSKTCNLKWYISKFKSFFISSALGVAVACFDLIPVALSLRDQKAAPSTSIFGLEFMFSLRDLYKAFLPGRFNFYNTSQYLPNVYMGFVALLFAAFLFISRKVSLREKAASVTLIGALVFCLWFKPVNTIWHAFNEPVGFAYRFAFYLSFVLLVIAYRGYNEAKTMLEKALEKNKKAEIIRKCAALTVLMIALTEILYNSYFVMKINISECKPQTEYSQYYNRVNPVIENIKSFEKEDTGTEKSLYRIEKDFLSTMEDPMVFDYAGLSHNSSCEKDYVKDFMGKMGLRNQGIWAFYNQGSTTFTDSFLGVKYFVSRFDSTEKPYTNILSSEDTYTFKNPYALPFAFMMDENAARSVEYKDNNSFTFQNDIAGAFGLNADIYTEASVSQIRVCGDNVFLSDSFMEHAGGNRINIVRLDKNYEAAGDAGETEAASFVEFDINVEKPQQILYMYFGAPENQGGVRLYVNGNDWDDYFTDWRWAVEKCGTFEEGSTVTVRVSCIGEKLLMDDYQFYFEDLSMIEKWYDAAENKGADTVNLSKVSSSHLKGTFEAKESGLLVFSIPYEKGWKIKVDGNTLTQQEVLSALMSVEVSEGVHTIEMTYIPEGLVPGCMISLITLFIINMLYLKEKRAKRKSEKD